MIMSDAQAGARQNARPVPVMPTNAAAQTGASALI